MGKKKGDLVRWIRPDEEVPGMKRRFPACALCAKDEVFMTAIGVENGLPVCEKHFTVDLDIENLDLSIEEI